MDMLEIQKDFIRMMQLLNEISNFRCGHTVADAECAAAEVSMKRNKKNTNMGSV
jgi:hypothetical protein